MIKDGNCRKLYAHLDCTEEAGRIRIEIPRDIPKGRKKREALLSIKYSMIEIAKPKSNKILIQKTTWRGLPGLLQD